MLTAFATILILVSPLAAPAQAHASTCSTDAIKAGLCGNSGGAASLTISGTQQHPGTPATPSTPGTPGTHETTTHGAPADPAPPSDRAIRLADCMDDFGTVRCHTLAAPEQVEHSPAPLTPTPATPTITLTDLTRFAPAPLTATAEPGNIGIADLPTNFTSAATTHTQTGDLFGIPLIARFTPTAYTYDYGDRTSATLTAPGRTWDALGLPQLTPTPTSHTYRERGDYVAHVDVRYTVEIDLGTGWIPLPGEITTTGIPQTIRILEAHTALVARTCTEDPRGDGC